MLGPRDVSHQYLQVLANSELAVSQSGAPQRDVHLNENIAGLGPWHTAVDGFLMHECPNVIWSSLLLRRSKTASASRRLLPSMRCYTDSYDSAYLRSARIRPSGLDAHLCLERQSQNHAFGRDCRRGLIQRGLPAN